MATLFLWNQFSSATIQIMVLASTMLLLGVAGSSGLASERSNDVSESAQLTLKTDRVIVFKDGYCLVVKKGTATTNADGLVFTDEVPDAAVLGSFWAVPEHGTIKSLVAGWVDSESETKRELTCINIVEIVKSNLGKECSFEIGEQRIAGTLLKILSNDDLPNDLEDLSGGSQSSSIVVSNFTGEVAGSSSSQISISQVSATYFLVRTHDGDVMVQANQVKNLTVENMNSLIEKTVTKKTRHKRLSMNFGEANTEVKINLMYFRPDVRWIPTYRVNLTGQPDVSENKGAAENENTDRKMAEILMQGEILNEAEDFIDVPIHVVVGVPNFRFRSVPSPMVLEASMRNVLSQASPDMMNLRNNGFSNANYITQRSSDFRGNRPAGDEASAAIDLPDELTGKSGNDLFVYELAPMTLKRGERAMVPILRTQVVYRDIYTWDINLIHSENFAASSADSPSPLTLSENMIWRQVELINNTDIPWTTGAAMFVDGNQPLAQELLTYTSPGGICRVPVTVSVDLRGKAEDSETKREFSVLKWRGHDYARVEGKINIELANNKSEPVPVEVRLRFGGKTNQVSDEGKITTESFRQEDWQNRQGDAINNSSTVSWTATVQPGECFEPVVDYEFYLRY